MSGSGREAPGLQGIFVERAAPPVLEHSLRRAKGYIQVVDPEGKTVEGETLMCCHCQMHWIVCLGSGKQRGFCFRCAGPTCGKQQCEVQCIPFERAIEIMEWRDLLRRKIIGLV